MHLPGSFLFVQNRRYPNDPPCMAYFSIYIRHSESNKCPVSIFIIISRSFYAPQILSDLISIDLSHLTSYLQASGFMKKRCYQKKKKRPRGANHKFSIHFLGGWHSIPRSQSQASERRRVTRRSALPALVWNHLSRWVFSSACMPWVVVVTLCFPNIAKICGV